MEPVYPFTEVSVNGIVPKPLEGIVTLEAVIVKLGVAASACNPENPVPSISSDPKQTPKG